MITADEARQLVPSMTLEDVEVRIRQQAAMGNHDAHFQRSQWEAAFGAELERAGYGVRLGGADNDVVIVSWKGGDK